MSEESGDREARLAEALRANLLRRKAQARARENPGSDAKGRRRTGETAEKGKEPAKP